MNKVTIETPQAAQYLFSFVLLYYKDYENTISCINSILKQECKEYSIRIVIVDNNSGDGALEKLKVHFRNNDNIYYIKCNENLGFAKGNNVGISFARKELKADFIVVLNTDTVIEQNDFCKNTVMVYKKEEYDVMGPAVKGYYSGNNQSPIYRTYKQNTQIKILKDGIKWLLWKINIAQYIENNKKSKESSRLVDIQSINRYECVCSGCCLVFSPHFFKRWNGFYPGTFLYREESILFYVINKLGGKTCFSDLVMIRHKGGESTSKEFGKDERTRNLRIYANRLESLKNEIRLKRMGIEELSKQI